MYRIVQLIRQKLNDHKQPSLSSTFLPSNMSLPKASWATSFGPAATNIISPPPPQRVHIYWINMRNQYWSVEYQCLDSDELEKYVKDCLGFAKRYYIFFCLENCHTVFAVLPSLPRLVTLSSGKYHVHIKRAFIRERYFCVRILLILEFMHGSILSSWWFHYALSTT